MTLNSNDAQRALDDIENAANKSAALRGYVASGAYLVVWGLVWIAGGASSLLSPEASRWGWPVAIAAGVVASLVLGMRARSDGRASKGTLGKVLASMLTMAVISVALSLVMDVASMREGTAMQSLIVAGAYMAYGVWGGMRIFLLGLALTASVLIGWFYLPAQFELFVGVAGGLMLIISGLWLRKA